MCQFCATLKTFSSDCIFTDEAGNADIVADTGIVTDTTFADVLATDGTDATVSVGGSYVGELEISGDSDWIAVNLVAGQTYTISLSGYGDTPVSDTYLRLFDPSSQDRATGTQVAYDDDGGAGYYSSLTFTATMTGTYYIDAGSYADYYTGDYIVEVSYYEEPDNTAFWTTQQIADQLTTGYWGGTQRSFNVGADNAITYNLTALDATYAQYAREALLTWSDIIGVQFVETTGLAEISFTENGSMEAWSSSSRSGTTITGSTVNIASDWLSSQGSAYTFQTFIHEIGHALGLGHAGNYNGTASYGTDNLYANDSWQATVMSYFSQTQNTAIDASRAYLKTPMLADIVAIRDLYGTTGTTRTGDTVYGYNNNTGDSSFNASVLDDTGTNYALTIVDDGGFDTIDMSGSSDNNRIDLTPGAISDMGGLTGNITIGPDTIIESAIGGSGNDTITGNDAGNVLFGNGGNDTLNGGAGDDFLDGGTGSDAMHGGDDDDTIVYDASDNWAGGAVTGGAGFDTLFFEAVLYAVDLAAYGFEQAALHLIDTASELWSEIYDHYDTGYRLTEQQTFFDDGTSEVIVYDVDNAQSWSEWIRTYDASGQLTGETFVPDAGGNTAPVAAADQVTTAEDTPLASIDVLANDSDADGDALAIDGTPTAEHGTVTVNADGTINYTPEGDFNGADTITYVVSDGNGGTATGTVDVTVTPVNDGPVANDDAYSTTAGVALSNLDVLANDSDPEGDALSIVGTPAAANGTVTVNPDGTINYTPNADFNGIDTITYAVTDGNGGTATGTVEVTVERGNADPVTTADTFETSEDAALTNLDILGNDRDDDGDVLSIDGTPTAEHGTVSVNPDGTINYTPDTDFNGTDTITYAVIDGNGGTATGTATITITPVNDAPITTADAFSTLEDIALTGLDVLSNDSDPDGDILSIDGTPTAANGTVSVNADSTINYTPNAGFVGIDQITYTVTDGQNGTATGIAEITVESADQPLDPAQGVTIGVLAIDPSSFLPRNSRPFTATSEMAGALDDGSITITDTQDLTFADDNRGETATSSGTVGGTSWTGIDTDNESQWLIESLDTGEQITIFRVDVEGSIRESYWGATGELVEGARYRVISADSNPDASGGVAYDDMVLAQASNTLTENSSSTFDDAIDGVSSWNAGFEDHWADMFSQWRDYHGFGSDWII